MLKKFSFFLVILLSEGAALMAVELMGAKLVAPFYGSSLYVWTAVLGFTVSGLTLGYFSGGNLAARPLSEKTLFIILGISAVLVLAMPYTTTALISLTGGMSLVSGICITCLLLLVPPMLCFGMVGPIVVKLIDQAGDNKGGVAGTVYFVSTTGGIVATFLLGCWLIPVAGLKLCSLVTGIILAVLPIIYIVRVYLLKTPHLSAGRQLDVNNIINRSANYADKIKPSIYLYAVLEGAAVMATELIAARMLAPWFGESLYVWATVMAVTLTGLALGYFWGGSLPKRYRLPDTIWLVLLAAACFILMMHITALQLTTIFSTINIKTSVIFVCSVLLLPPLTLLGMVPTLLIRYIAEGRDGIGAATGRVFTISSASGILVLFVIGFYVIPQYGLTAPSICLGVMVGIVPFLKLVTGKRYISLLFVVFILCSLSLRKTISDNADIEVKYFSEGLLGQVLVSDINKYDTSVLNARILLVNRIGEAEIDKTNGITKWKYPVYVTSVCSKLPEKSDALMLGLGGGQIPNMLRYLKFNVDVVELDQRIEDVAREYFFLDKDVNVVIDDARHYLETTKKTYDVIIIDVFHGDIAPNHLLSIESFKKAGSLLNKNGFIIVNFLGYISGDLGKPGRSVYSTMTAAGLLTKILPTTGKEEGRNSLFIGSKENISFATIRSQLALYGKNVDIDTLYLDTKKMDLKSSIIFTDDKPELDLLNINGVINFRSSYSDITKHFLNGGVPLFR